MCYNLSSELVFQERQAEMREFFVVIEQDEDGMYVGEVQQLRACYSHGKTIDELMANMREVIALCLEDEQEETQSQFVGVQKLVV